MEQKKILLIASEFPPQWGGVATYSYEIAKGFSEKGYSVTVITGLTNQKMDFEFNIHRIKLGKTGISSIPYLSFQLIRLLRKESYDHIFCSLWLPGAASLYLAQKFLKTETPYSISVHAMEVIESNENIRKRFRQKLSPLKNNCFKGAKKIFCVSHFSKKLIESLLPLKPGQAVVVNNGANSKHFFPENTSKTHSYPQLFSACRLIPNKGIDQVIKALPDLIKKNPNLQYRIAGEGRDRARLEKLAKMMQVKEHIKFLGKISLKQLRTEFQQADLFVMLSRKEKHFVEGFGLVFLEAALCKTASLGGNSGGIPDAIEDNVTGWLVDPYNEKTITEKLLAILSDQETLKNVSEQAYQKTINGKTWPHRIEEFCTELGFK